MKVGLDIMGGDYAPVATVAGAILAKKELHSSDQVVLIGDEALIREELVKSGVEPGAFEIVHAPEVIGMGEKPVKAITKKTGSSISVGFNLLKNRDIDAFTGAGNSGAMLVGAMYSVNTIEGIMRPCTCTVLPQEPGGHSVLLDIGTNPDIRAEVIYQFAILGSLYAEYVLSIPRPKVGLLNIGTEEEKGNLLCQSSYKLMDQSADFNFTGNIEARDLLKGKADVIVCDGFTGNMVLKLVETFYRMTMKRGISDDFFTRLNYENYGGSPILGVNGTVILGHGISSAVAIKNMILSARDIHTARLNQRIKAALRHYAEVPGEN